MPYEQTGLTGHGQSRATQRLPLQRTHRPLPAVLQRRRRRTAGGHTQTDHSFQLTDVTSDYTSVNQYRASSGAPEGSETSEVMLQNYKLINNQAVSSTRSEALFF